MIVPVLPFKGLSKFSKLWRATKLPTSNSSNSGDVGTQDEELSVEDEDEDVTSVSTMFDNPAMFFVNPSTKAPNLFSITSIFSKKSIGEIGSEGSEVECGQQLVDVGKGDTVGEHCEIC